MKPETALAKIEDLTEKQRLFCLEYLKDFNATRAAITAGYSKKTAYRTGADNLKNPQIQRYLGNMVQQRMEAAKVEADHIVMEWRDLAFSTMGDFVVIDDNGSPRIDLKRIKDSDKLKHVRKVNEKVLRTDDDGSQLVETSLELYDRTKGLEALSKYFKLYADMQPAPTPEVPESDHERVLRGVEALAQRHPAFAARLRQIVDAL